MGFTNNMHIRICPLLNIFLTLWPTYTQCSRAGSIRENIAPAARAIQRINSYNIALQEWAILESLFLEIKNVFIMTLVGIYRKIYPEPSENPLDSSLGISVVLMLYFTVYPSSCHNTDRGIFGVSYFVVNSNLSLKPISV